MTPNREDTEGAARHIAEATGTRPAPGLLRKMLEAQQREKNVIVAELVKVKGLMPLLMKHRNGSEWSHQEREELHEQMRAMAHLSPYLVVLVLPGSFMVMPVLAWWLDRRRGNRPGAGQPPLAA